jgi:hypothetical protein
MNLFGLSVPVKLPPLNKLKKFTLLLEVIYQLKLVLLYLNKQEFFMEEVLLVKILLNLSPKKILMDF